MASEKKSKKPRKNKYEEKVQVEATFDELMTVLFPPANCKEPPTPKVAKAPAKKATKK